MARVYQRKTRPNESRSCKRGPKPGSQVKGHKSSAINHKLQDHRDNLTLGDWFEVFAYVDANPQVPQTRVTSHFRNRPQRALIFHQGTLSRKLRQRDALTERSQKTPTAMSSKRPHAVTHPAVESALVLWQKSMEDKNEIVSGSMLMAKRTWFEDQFGVPEEQRLRGKGWVQPFLRNFQIKSIQRHGEAASVNLDDVAQERLRMAVILSQFAPEDRFNLDETGLYAFAPPDRGLATKQMSGKKTSKFRITLSFVCNAMGTEKEEPLIIGKSAMPRCFAKISPERRGFYYRNNASAWMTAVIFKEWLMKFDCKMRGQGRNVILLVDNFAGHIVPYVPTNVRLEFFKPNMTAFVQPLDAGIIRCFKAFYRQTYCLRAIDLDEAGERDIYKINLLEAMLIAKNAWRRITPETIQSCWAHTKIQQLSHSSETAILQPTAAPSLSSPLSNSGAWDILRNFASGDVPLPQIEEQLKNCLGNQYAYSDWKPAFDAVFQAEDDTLAATLAINELAKCVPNSGVSRPVSITHSIDNASPQSMQLNQAESSLLQSVEELKKRHRIIGTAPTLEDLLNPSEEHEVGRPPYHFDNDEEIVTEVKRMMDGNPVEEIGESDDESDEDDDSMDTMTTLTLRDGVDLCARLEGLCLLQGDDDDVLELTRLLRRFRGHLFQKDIHSCKQTTLNKMWGLSS